VRTRRVRQIASADGFVMSSDGRWVAWQSGGFVKRNRPRTYNFDHLPEALLP